MNLLLIYYNFPPVKVPGAIRIFNFYQEAQKHFAQIHAITSANRHLLLQDPSLETHCPHITEVPAYDLRRLTLKKNQENTPYLNTQQQEHPLTTFLRRLLNSFPFNILIGDGGAYYIWQGYQAGKKLVKEQGITHLFSTYRPYSDHIIAYLLKRRFPHLIWVADFRDLHVDPVLKNVVWPAFQRRCNRLVLRRADVVSTVSEGLKESLEEVHGKVHVLRNGIGRYDKTDQPLYERFTIAYTGSLYPGLQDPQPLFKAIKTLLQNRPDLTDRVELIYAGKDHTIWEKWVTQAELNTIARTYRSLPLKAAREIQQRSHVNLLLSWSQPGSQGILTGKLFEYLAAGRPILGLVNGQRDEEWQHIFDRLPNSLGWNSQQSNAILLLFLEQQLDHWGNGEEAPVILEECVAPYRWPVQFREFMAQSLKLPQIHQ